MCVCVCEGNLLEWLTACGQANLKMTGYEQEAQESSICSVPEAGYLCWSFVDTMES